MFSVILFLLFAAMISTRYLGSNLSFKPDPAHTSDCFHGHTTALQFSAVCVGLLTLALPKFWPKYISNGINLQYLWMCNHLINAWICSAGEIANLVR